MAVTTIEKFVVALGFDFDPKDLTKFKQGVENVETVVKGLTKTLVGATAAIFGLTAATTDAVDEQGKMANQIGISVEDLDAYETAASLAGDSVGAMSSSLQQLSIRASEASRGMGSGIEAFGILGISATDTNGNLKNTIQLMLEVSGAIQGLDKAKQIELAEKLGLSSSIRLLQQGPAAIQELVRGVKELGVTTKEDAAIAAEFQDSLVNMWKVIKQGSKLITRTFAPIMTDISDKFLKWWKVNQEIIKQRHPEWIEKTARMFKLLGLAVGIFVGAQLVTIVATLIKSFKGLGVLISVINKKLLLIPSLIAIGIAALLLLAQDAKTFFEGGESFIGDWIKRFPEFESAILTAAAAFASVWDIVQLIGSGLKQLFDVVSNLSFDGIRETISLLPGWFSSALSGMTNLFTEFIGFLISKIPEFKNAILSITSAFSFDNLKQVFAELKILIISVVADMITAFQNGFAIIATSLIDSFKNALSEIFKGLSDGVGNIATNIGTRLKGTFGKLFGSGEDTNNANNFLTPGAPLVPNVNQERQLQNGDTSTTNTNNTATTNIGIIEITIDGSQDPTAIAEELQRNLQQASQDVNSGVFQ